MPLFFAVTPKSKCHYPNTHAPAEKIGFQAAANQQTKTEGHQGTTAKLVFSTHEKHLLHKPMQEVSYYSIYRSFWMTCRTFSSTGTQIRLP